MQTDIKSILINLSKEDYDAAKQASDKLGISLTSFIRLLLKQWTDGIRFEKDKDNSRGGDNGK